MANTSPKHPDSDLIDQLGGTCKAAEFFDVAPASVSDWRKTGFPRARRMYLQVMRPDLFPGVKIPKPKRIPRTATP